MGFIYFGLFFFLLALELAVVPVSDKSLTTICVLFSGPLLNKKTMQNELSYGLKMFDTGE